MFFCLNLKKESLYWAINYQQKAGNPEANQKPQKEEREKKKSPILSSFSFFFQALNSFGSHMGISRSRTEDWAIHTFPDVKSVRRISAPWISNSTSIKESRLTPARLNGDYSFVEMHQRNMHLHACSFNLILNPLESPLQGIMRKTQWDKDR